MKSAIFALLASTAAAFAPSLSNSRASTAVGATDFSSKPGVIAPTGYFDPLGLATSEKRFDFYRSVELKHGRVAMLAVLGYVVPEFARFGYDIDYGLPCSAVRNGLAAFDDIPPLGWVQMIFFIGFVDQYGILGDFEVGKPDLEPETLAKRQTQELQHGRLAMLATAELFRHDLSGGADGLDNLITGLPFLYN